MSELTKLLEQIDLEITSMHRHREVAMTARHAFIQARMDRLSESYTNLTPLIGEQQALRVVNRAMERMADVMTELETQPLPVVPTTLRELMDAYALDQQTLASRAGLPTMTIWRACQGLSIAPAHAATLARTVRQLTGIDLTRALASTPTEEH